MFLGDITLLVNRLLSWRISINCDALGNFTTRYLYTFLLFHWLLCLISSFTHTDPDTVLGFPFLVNTTMVYCVPIIIVCLNQYLIVYPVLWNFQNKSTIHPFVVYQIPYTLLFFSALIETLRYSKHGLKPSYRDSNNI